MPSLTRRDSNDSTRKVDSEKGQLAESIVAVQSNHDVFDDPNLDQTQVADGIEDDSPYPEVRSAVANTDDPDMPASTLRAWVIGMAWAIVIPGLNQFFFFRYPSVNIGGIVTQLLSFPMGRAAAAWIPNWSVCGVRINPGPFTVKEHVLVTIMASVGAGSAYATDIFAVQKFYYNQNYNFSYQWFVVMSTQLIGFSVGGIARRFLVAPPSMIWPATLVNCVFFNTLHSQNYSGIGGRGGMSRERFFLIAFSGSFAWYFVPGYLFQALSFFSWVTWIAPENATVAQLFGYIHGLGLSLVTFDWSQVVFLGNPLVTPWWAEVNTFAGFVVFFWILAPILHFTNTWYGLYMPISARTSYDNTGGSYNVSRILTTDSTFDIDAYRTYSPLFLSTTMIISYGLSFASITATVTHTILYFRKQIVTQARRSMGEQPDIHARLMSRYPQVPEWWYAVIFLSMFALGIISIEMWPTEMPVWAFVSAIAISFFYIIPAGMIQALTNTQIGLNVITELIIGYCLPGRPIAMMLFKTWGYITMAQALTFTSDFKLGHYMKVPPRPMFWCQIIATAVAGTVQLGVQSWMFSNIKGICTMDQPDGFICPATQAFGTASIIWGVIGPALQFSKGQMYYPLTFFFLLGAVAPVVPWALSKKYSKPFNFSKYINFPVLFSGAGMMPPATSVNYVSWIIVGFISQYFIRRKHFSWWSKYNYVLAAALDLGVAMSIIVIFFTLQFPKNGTIGADTVATWWGNTIPFTGADAMGKAIRGLAEGETFGPATW